MKLSVLLILIFPILTFGQSFKLPEPNVKELKDKMVKSDYTKEVVYLYLIQNFDTISKKREIINYDYPDYSICSFNQNFENDINYSLEKCKEAGGLSVLLMLPKTDRQSLIKWIELIYKSAPMDIEHTWNSSKTKFGPTDEGVGCYFEIKETERNTLIENYCGC